MHNDEMIDVQFLIYNLIFKKKKTIKNKIKLYICNTDVS